LVSRQGSAGPVASAPASEAVLAGSAVPVSAPAAGSAVAVSLPAAVAAASFLAGLG